MLGLASLAKLYYTYKLVLPGHLFLLLALLLFFGLIGKMLFAWSAVRQELSNPVVTSVAPTFLMGTMVLCSVFFSYDDFERAATLVWVLAACLQFCLVGYFTWRFVWGKWQLANVLPSWFVTYVGIGIIPVTAPAFIPSVALHGIFYIAIALYFMLLPLILYRVIVREDLPEPTMPMTVILAAPGSLCLLGYLAQFEAHDQTFVVLLFILSQLLYLFVLTKLPKLLKLPFYPSYAAFTFPLVISATAFYMARDYFGLTNIASLLMAYAELCIATIVVLYVFVRYIRFIYK